MVELSKLLPTHSSIAERDVQRATAVSKRWGRGTVGGSNESLTISSTVREREREIKDESHNARSGPRAGGRGNTMREYYQDESKKTALNTLDALAQLPAEACGDVPKSQKLGAEAETDQQNMDDLERRAPKNKTRRKNAKDAQLREWAPLTCETMPFSVTHGVKLLQSNTKIADMQEMLVGYATTHAPELASTVAAKLAVIVEVDRKGTALRHALISLLLDDLHDGSLDQSTLYSHAYAMESRFDQRAEAVAVLLNEEAYTSHSALQPKHRPERLEGEKKKEQFNLRVTALERAGLLEHAYRRSAPAPSQDDADAMEGAGGS